MRDVAREHRAQPEGWKQKPGADEWTMTRRLLCLYCGRPVQRRGLLRRWRHVSSDLSGREGGRAASKLLAFVAGNGYEVYDGLQGRHALPMDNSAPLAELEALLELEEAVIDFRRKLDEDGYADDEVMGLALTRLDQVRNG